ncbi:hypothetical protein DRO91_02270 [Candidatus Heimdallarchaeota archaeon]|nr:MAG: hypothetical protein DRP02_08300 [Candidatus Gerdarchaeota archaeon]RLI73737.1 MAG: hypothetical protein DRO91_02270 [Candidatus Heimdallarchaeota archaeon]
MGMELQAKKIDLVVMTGSVPFITAGLFQEDQTDATLLSGALAGMSTMFQELLQQGELRHSELFNAHIYIRHLTQINNSLGLVNPELLHSAQMKVAIIVQEGELTRAQELSLSELCYSLMVVICSKPHLAKKLATGNVEGYIPSSRETIEILAEAIADFRKRAKRSLFYETPKFLQEKDRFSNFPSNDSLLEEEIANFSKWVEEQSYPLFFEKLPFTAFFGKQSYWEGFLSLKNSFQENFPKEQYREQVTATLFNFVLKGGLIPFLLYTGNIVKRLTTYYEREFPAVFERFLENLLKSRGPIGISLRAIDTVVKKLSLSDTNLVSWQFIRSYLQAIGNRPFEVQYLKQLCKLLEKFALKEAFLRAILQSSNEITPANYRTTFVTIINDLFTKPVEIQALMWEINATNQTKNASLSPSSQAPAIPSVALTSSEERPLPAKKAKKAKRKEDAITLPKPTPESQQVNNQALLRAISDTFFWAHNYLYGSLSFINGTLPSIGREGALFYNISESLTIEIGLILNLIQAFSGPRTWLIGQIERAIEDVENRVRAFSPGEGATYNTEPLVEIDLQHVDEAFQATAKAILVILKDIEEDAVEGKITAENKKSYLETGFLGRIQERSIPHARKLLAELKTMNKRLMTKELAMISEATAVNFKGLTNNVTSLQLLAVPLPSKESDYPKETRECFTAFKKWGCNLNDAIRTLFNIGMELPEPLSPRLHKEIQDSYLRLALPQELNQRLESLTESTKQRQLFVKTSYKIKQEIFRQIGKRLLHNKPLKVFTSIPLFKAKEERNYLFSFSPIKLPTVSEEIARFFITTNDSETPEILGRIYPYQPFDNEEINNLSELIISDAFRRAYATIEASLKKIITLGKRLHSGVPNLELLLLGTYQQICSQLTITKRTK